jgi:hypothetical protein
MDEAQGEVSGLKIHNQALGHGRFQGERAVHQNQGAVFGQGNGKGLLAGFTGNGKLDTGFHFQGVAVLDFPINPDAGTPMFCGFGVYGGGLSEPESSPLIPQQITEKSVVSVHLDAGDFRRELKGVRDAGPGKSAFQAVSAGLQVYKGKVFFHKKRVEGAIYPDVPGHQALIAGKGNRTFGEDFPVHGKAGSLIVQTKGEGVRPDAKGGFIGSGRTKTGFVLILNPGNPGFEALGYGASHGCRAGVSKEEKSEKKGKAGKKGFGDRLHGVFPSWVQGAGIFP